MYPENSSTVSSHSGSDVPIIADPKEDFNGTDSGLLCLFYGKQIQSGFCRITVFIVKY